MPHKFSLSLSHSHNTYRLVNYCIEEHRMPVYKKLIVQCPYCSSHQTHYFGKRAFPVAGSRILNDLPTDVTSATTLPVFCSCLKHTYFLILFLRDLCCFNLDSPQCLCSLY